MNHRISSPSFPLTPKEKSAVPNTEVNIQTGDNIRIITAQFSFYIKNMNSAAETYYLTNVMHQNGWQTWWSYTYIVVPPIYSLADTGLSLWLIQSRAKLQASVNEVTKLAKLNHTSWPLSMILSQKSETTDVNYAVEDNGQYISQHFCQWWSATIHRKSKKLLLSSM